MPNINLIAEKREEKKRLERITRRLFFGLAASVGAFLMLISFLGARRLSLLGEMADAESQMTRLKPTLARITEIENQTSDLTPKVDTLVTAKANTLRWRALFQVVSQSVPPSIWLSGMASQQTGTPGEENTTITLTGLAANQSLVGETMTRLGAYPLFDRVDLRFTQLSGSPTELVQRIGFEIGAHLKPTQEKKEEVKDGEATAKTAQGGAAAAAGGGSNNG